MSKCTCCSSRKRLLLGVCVYESARLGVRMLVWLCALDRGSVLAALFI